MLGVYKDELLFEKYQSDERASEFLPKILQNLLEKYSLEKLIYANGPGSFMGIKISFLCFQTLSIVKNIPMFAVSGFELNGFKPISANNQLCFVYENKQISLQKAAGAEFFLPDHLSCLNLSEDILPFYFIDAV
ncbi:glycoprotease [Campylobacter sp. MIT 99-7217]|uniref:tRNA threonylcarbamoyladenosine biosynthesis protein TsaB n=1 Tax=Campylobacter sp. MIT 99-7217 TaxID=535091 RepID=UPI00115B3F85|nr:tRNA threonylcarbamoyladenosine biosynthesis protein TsaB [Campylobacter sp. MIT 99-7217]TQR31285.1 glycoprotease [Campylobacter sp. MIT 99-7217]